ncbi:phosphate transporter [Ephemerocybe angulata]|uniref:Phosphate transporter n=1 Tax=Ephemerocybe angulata TaxID=980116 RepID=A0A8H6I845_9AGAR|nr:phosphate transporter [Tulosesus angulatus]
MPAPTKTRSRLEEVERESSGPAWMLTGSEAKLLGIAGVGFFLDAYDLFIINPVATMLQYRLYGGHHLPANLEGFVKAGANIGSVIGQFGFGYAADALGRQKVYGKELMLIIFATIMTLTTPTGSLSPDHALIYLGVWRIILGIGVGGDYPMSASVTSDRANIRKRGTMLTYIFSMQGWGSFMGSLMTIIVLAIYRHTIEVEGKTSKVDGVWRIVVGLSLIPAFGTLYQRLTLGESSRFEASQKIGDSERSGPSHTSSTSDEDEIYKLKELQRKEEEGADSSGKDGVEVGEGVEREGEGGEGEDGGEVEGEGEVEPDVLVKKPAHFKDFYNHFKQWRNGKMLLGTCLCWFLLDIAFYGINLNQNVVLQQIGFDGKDGTEWNKLFKVSTGNMIVTALGFVPGYYATLFTIEILGRKTIQIMGFLMAALFLGVLAGMFETLSKAQFIVCFAFLQFFFNFGANTTSYCYPAEVFPTRYKAFAHGISAACGKAGAILSALAFNTLSKSIGTPNCLWIFFGCCVLGAFATLLLPEVKGRDPDAILAQQIAEERAERMRRTGRSRD